MILWLVHKMGGRGLCLFPALLQHLVSCEVNGTSLLPKLSRVEMGWEVKLMFIKISGIFGGKFCSKMYEPLLFRGNKRDGV